MRDDSPIETRELADSDLDNVSGGILDQLVRSAEAAVPALSALPTVTAPVVGGNLGLQISGPIAASATLTGSAGL
jgi:hypothetical protein